MKLYNSLSNKIEDFKPLYQKKVLMYVCGITPYDTTHLGHAFTYIHFDVLQRFLKYKGFEVNYTQNVTDIDDDILKRSKEEGRDWQELGQFWTDKFLRDLKYLNIEMPTHYVKATGSIPKIIEIGKDLINKCYAYEKNGNVYFDVSTFPEYGKLSKLSPEEMSIISAQRGADPNDPGKKSPLDFILWQKMKGDEPFWESPWGKGRPGWHIECSAMISQYLGEQIDIHGGGGDLIYPHHESEIAQSESYTEKKPFSKLWMHIAMLYYQGEKMSKSLGNLIMVSELSKKYSGNSIRWLLLSNHYRKVWEYKDQDMSKAEKEFSTVEARLKKGSFEGEKSSKNVQFELEQLLGNDLNIPGVLKLAQKTTDLNDLSFILKTLGFQI